MVFRSSHINHEFLILVMQVTNVSSAIEQKVQKPRQLSQSKFMEGVKSYENDHTHFEYLFHPNF